MKKRTDILIGCDPEIFVYDVKAKHIVSAHGLINGDKMNPEITEFGAHQIDGMALEFNINPAATLDEFLFNIDHTMKSLEDKIIKKNPNLVFRITPVADFSLEYLDTVPKEAKILGCTPDYNAYTGKMNKTPDHTRPMRTASGHIHIGWTEDVNPNGKDHFFDCQTVVKQLDACLFNLSYLWDQDQRRREMYGERGCFRPKSYGVEYRVLSNKWIGSKFLQAWVYKATIRAMELLDEGIRIFDNTDFVLKGPHWAHATLVHEYSFPSLPGVKGVSK